MQSKASRSSGLTDQRQTHQSATYQKVFDLRKRPVRGQQFPACVLLMAYCGARRNETLRLKWLDVDWQQKQMTIGSDGLAKNHEARVVDFNSILETHLKEMLSCRGSVSEWMFPSPQRGDQDKRAKTFIETLKLARKESGLKMGFHDCCHFFISDCVMSGIDYMTIAK